MAVRGAPLRHAPLYATPPRHLLSARAASHLVLAADFHLLKLREAIGSALHTGRLHAQNERDTVVRGATGKLYMMHITSLRRFRKLWHAKNGAIVRSRRGDTMAAFGAASLTLRA